MLAACDKACEEKGEPKDQLLSGKVAGLNGFVDETLGWKRMSNYILGKEQGPGEEAI